MRAPAATLVRRDALRFPVQDADIAEDPGTKPLASLLVRDLPRGDLLVETKFSFDLPPDIQANFEQAGFALYKNDDAFVKLAHVSIFETRLTQLQDAYSREDLGQLRRITTPEVLGYLSDELREAEQKGLRNEVFDVRLLQGEVAEAWREGPSDYATVALHYESRDVMRERSTGTLVSGEDRLVERREVWTFVRHNGGDWLVSAIQS